MMKIYSILIIFISFFAYSSEHQVVLKNSSTAMTLPSHQKYTGPGSQHAMTKYTGPGSQVGAPHLSPSGQFASPVGYSGVGRFRMNPIYPPVGTSAARALSADGVKKILSEVDEGSVSSGVGGDLQVNKKSVSTKTAPGKSGPNDYSDDGRDKDGNLFDIDNEYQGRSDVPIDLHRVFPLQALAEQSSVSPVLSAKEDRAGEDLFIDELDVNFIGPRQFIGPMPEHQGPPLSFKAQATAAFADFRQSLSSGARTAQRKFSQGASSVQDSARNFLDTIRFNELSPGQQKTILGILITLIGLGLAGAASPSDFTNALADILKIVFKPS